MSRRSGSPAGVVALMAVLGLAALVLGFGIALVPLALFGLLWAVVWRWVGRAKAWYEVRRGNPGPGGVIETEYRVEDNDDSRT